MINTMKGKKGLHQKFIGKLSRSNIAIRLKIYGFIECGNIINFLNYVCEDECLDMASFRFIHSRVSDCLNKHDTCAERYNNVDAVYYFQDLKVLKDELEFVISLNHG